MKNVFNWVLSSFALLALLLACVLLCQKLNNEMTQTKILNQQLITAEKQTEVETLRLENEKTRKYVYEKLRK